MRYLAFFLMLSICVGCKDRPFNEQEENSVGADEEVVQKESDNETKKHDLDEAVHDSVRSGLALAPQEASSADIAAPRIDLTPFSRTNNFKEISYAYSISYGVL